MLDKAHYDIAHEEDDPSVRGLRDRALHHIDEAGTAETVQTALEQVYTAGKVPTRDVGGTSGTKAFTDAVIAAMYS